MAATKEHKGVPKSTADECPPWVDSVEKLSVGLVMLAVANSLARGNLLGMPPSAQMVVFVD